MRHGHSAGGKTTPTYNAWAAIISSKVMVVDEWRTFISFLNDMGEKPSGKHFIFRFNQDLPFGPSNCIWSDAKRSRVRKPKPIDSERFSVFVTAFGESKTLAGWARDPRCAVKAHVLWYRSESVV